MCSSTRVAKAVYFDPQSADPKGDSMLADMGFVRWRPVEKGSPARLAVVCGGEAKLDFRV